MWSIGCILAETLTKKILFPGSSFMNQIELILKICGTPDEESLNYITNRHANRYIRGLPKYSKPLLSNIIKSENKQCIDLLESILQFNPHYRITFVEALRHP